MISGFQLSKETQRLALGQPFVLDSGEVLPRVELAYRTWGQLNSRADNAIVVCQALTGSADADDWWGAFFGAGRVLDPQHDFIVCSNVLGGCYGSTGPTSIADDGKPWGSRFPRISIADQVRAQIALADALRIKKIRSVIGGSMGGFQALEWALQDPERVETVVSIAAAGKASHWSLAWSGAQRMALVADPAFRNGDYLPESPPRAGLAAARAIAMISYRSAVSLNNRSETYPERFSEEAGETVFSSQRWLLHHGNALVDRFDANSYLRLLDALDSYDIGASRGGFKMAVSSIRQPVLIGSVYSDLLYTPEDQKALLQYLQRGQCLGTR